MIVLKNITKKFGARTVLQGISLQIDPGEFVCITGPSGAGKSTLLSLFVGAQRISGGSITIDDVNLEKVPVGALQLFRRKVGMVFQEYKLLQNRTVAENIAFPLEVCGVPDPKISKRVQELLKRMNLSERGQALPSELSGGEKARVAIARAIAHKPLILLADEPTGNLDREQAKSVLSLFHEIHSEGTTVILATHDPDALSSGISRLVKLDKGKIVEDTAVKGSKSSSNVDMSSEAAPVAKKEETKAEAAIDADAQEKNTVPGRRKIRITSIHSDS